MTHSKPHLKLTRTEGEALAAEDRTEELIIVSIDAISRITRRVVEYRRPKLNPGGTGLSRYRPDGEIETVTLGEVWLKGKKKEDGSIPDFVVTESPEVIFELIKLSQQ